MSYFYSEDKKAICIYCLNEISEVSDEHVPPESIGGSLIIKTCKRCNNDLGKHIDEPFANFWFTRLSRARKGIKTKRGEKVTHSYGECRSANNLNQRVKFTTSKDGGELLFYPITEEDAQGKKFITGSKELVGKMKGITPEILKKGSIKASDINIKFKINLEPFSRGIIKIMYDLSCFFLREKFLLTGIGSKLREYLFKSDIKIADTDIPYRDCFNLDPIYYDFYVRQNKFGDKHVIVFREINGHLLISVLLFGEYGGILDLGEMENYKEYHNIKKVFDLSERDFNGIVFIFDPLIKNFFIQLFVLFLARLEIISIVDFIFRPRLRKKHILERWLEILREELTKCDDQEKLVKRIKQVENYLSKKNNK